MISNIFKIWLRHLRRHKAYSAINIVGMAIGMASCIVVFLFVRYELSFDRFNANADRTYRVLVERTRDGITKTAATTPAPLAPAMMNAFPAIGHFVRFLTMDNPAPMVRYGDKRFYEQRFSFCDSTVFDVFSFRLVEGDTASALREPFSVVVTQDMAQKYFGSEDPLGKTLSLEDQLQLNVTGVLQNLPPNSTVKSDFLVSFSTLDQWFGKPRMEDWKATMFTTYVLLSSPGSAADVERSIPAFIGHQIGNDPVTIASLRLQPLTRIHLYSDLEFGLSSDGDVRKISIFSMIALGILLIACINSMNLSTARSTARMKEVGMRKTLGAVRSQLALQFLNESVLSGFLALFVAFALVELVLPYFNQLMGIHVAIRSDDFELLALCVAFALIVGMISGSYPALILSSFRPAAVLGGRARVVDRRISLRRVLVVAQFTLSIVLIVGMLTVRSQLSYMRNTMLGFDKEQVAIVPIRDQRLRQNTDLIKQKLRSNPSVRDVAAASLLPGGPVGEMLYSVPGEAGIASIRMQTLWVDYDFLRTLGIDLLAGRAFSKAHPTDETAGFVLNESAVRELGWRSAEEAIGRKFNRAYGQGAADSAAGTIIGVVKDFHFRSLRTTIEPLVIHIWPWMNYLVVRILPDRIPQTLGFLESTLKEFDPGHPFEYSFLDQRFDGLYWKEMQQENLFEILTSLAIFISCLGLYGLFSFTVGQRTKEIGIRKVLGASLQDIVGSLTKESAVLVLVANVLAWPMAYFAATSWLQQFAYRIDLTVGTFMLAGGAALLIALMTISSQAIKASLANPVEALRYE